MSHPPKNLDDPRLHERCKAERRAKTREFEKATQTYYCRSGNHRTGQPYVMRNGRRMCVACRDKALAARRRQP